MAERPEILSAKLDKLAAVIADGNQTKQDLLADEAREKQKQAALDVLDAGGSVSDVEDVKLPSER